MGYYINVPGMEAKGKADYLKEHEGAEEFPTAPQWDSIPEGKALVVVVSNMAFDAALYAYSEEERNMACDRSDPRPKRYLLMDEERVWELSGFPGDRRRTSV